MELLDGKIIDGRNRYLACKQLGIEPKTVKVTPENPVSYVVSKNLHRRHLNASQCAMAAARAMPFYTEAAKGRQKQRKGKQPGASVENLPQLSEGKARDQAGRDFEVSGKSVDMARKVLDKGTPQLVKAVAACRVAVGAAARS